MRTPLPESNRPSPQVLAEAANWYATLHAPQVSSAEQARWRAWLESSSEHRRAWARVEGIDSTLQGLAGEPARAALEAPDLGRRRFLRGLAGVAVATPALWLAWRSAPLERWQADYLAGVGERRELLLEDGTTLWLDTRSAVNIRYQAGQRSIQLLAGRIAVRTGVDPRPMVVHTRAGEARPLGTWFSLQEQEQEIALEVYEGRVALLPRQAPGSALVVESGQRARFSSQAPGRAQPLHSAYPAWSRGILVADGMRLDDFLRELSRYRHGRLAVDPQVAHLRLVGAYPLDDHEGVFRALEQSLPVQVAQLTPWWVRVRAR